MTITERLTLLIEHLGHEVSWEASPVQMGMDSMDYVEWGMLIEQEFMIEFTIAELSVMRDVPMKGWVEWIDNKMRRFAA